MQFWTLDIEKQIGDRLQIILTDPHLMGAYQRFGGEILRRSSVFHGLGRFLREQKVGGDCCFEIGTWNGLTAVVLSQFFKEVVTVDIAHNEQKREIVDYLGIKNIRFVDIADNQEKAKLARETRFDFAYLDGNHTDDTTIDWNLTKHCRRVLFHEVWPFQPPVWELVHSLPYEQVAQNGLGLALWDSTK